MEVSKAKPILNDKKIMINKKDWREQFRDDLNIIYVSTVLFFVLGFPLLDLIFG